MKAITNHTVSKPSRLGYPPLASTCELLLQLKHGWISSSSVCVDATVRRFPRRRMLPSFSAPFLRRRRSVSRLTQHSPQLLISVPNSFFTMRDDRMLPALTVRVNVLSVHLKSDLYLDGIWVACVASPSVRSRRLETKTCSLCSVGAYTNRHSTCTCTLQVSLRDSVAAHSTSVRLLKSRSSSTRGSACSHALSHSLCELSPLKPPLVVLGIVVQVFSSLRGLCSMYSMVAASCHVPLPSCSASSDSTLVLCDACEEWTSGAGLCRRLVDS